MAMALGLAGVAQLVTLLALLRRKVGRLGLRAVGASAARVAAASAAMGGVCWAVARYGDWARGGSSATNLLVLGGALVAGGATFLVAAKLLRAPELDDLVLAVRRRLSR
ncbi:MAG: hypothetical protein M5U28_20475 [Sandaracinaceae bacterium]|nr:hypothetical protein [Sandaracinaceae bacterium]